MMESAIPSALRCPRNRPRRIEDDYTPPYPAWVARADAPAGQVVMGYFGVQALGRDGPGRSAFAHLVERLKMGGGPDHLDLAHSIDAQGYDTLIAIAYFLSPARFDQWHAAPTMRDWWESPARLAEGVGYFHEILRPSAEGFETLFSAADQLEGIGVAMGTRSSADIQEHGYWGSMRDRLARSQTDAMVPSGGLAVASGRPGFGERVRLQGHENLTVIRSGQDWSATTGRERDLYVEEMEPVFRRGMDFLRDRGAELDCYLNRYMRHIDGSSQPHQKTFGHSYWRSLSALEGWSESHPTHLAIFGTFMHIVQELKFQVQLRLYHEVSVLQPDQQDYEYINCHPRTGLLNGLGV